MWRKEAPVYAAQRASTEEWFSDAWTMNQRDSFSVRKVPFLPVLHRSLAIASFIRYFINIYNLVTFSLFSFNGFVQLHITKLFLLNVCRFNYTNDYSMMHIACITNRE